MRDDYECRDSGNQSERPLSLGNSILLAIGVVIFFLAFSSCVITAFGSPPDPWVRMTSPSGCSGGVFHASREYGIWIATCKHCVNRDGRVRLVFFQDGQRANVDAYFVRSHPRYDCSILWTSADNFYELPQQAPIADSWFGPYKGQAVYSVGSYAGRTIHPAARHLAVSSIDRGGYQFRLNDYAWGGHSGGPVVDAFSGKMLGVLWGTSGRTSLVTSNRALLETVYGTPKSYLLGKQFVGVTGKIPYLLGKHFPCREPSVGLLGHTWNTGQGMYSVHDDIYSEPVARKPEIDVKANRNDLYRIQREVAASHVLRDHFDWDWDVDSWRDTPRIEWRKANGRRTYSDGWHGQDGFIWQYRNGGGQFL